MAFIYKLEFLKLLLRLNISQVFIKALYGFFAHLSIRVFVFLTLFIFLNIDTRQNITFVVLSQIHCFDFLFLM